MNTITRLNRPNPVTPIVGRKARHGTWFWVSWHPKMKDAKGNTYRKSPPTVQRPARKKLLNRIIRALRRETRELA